MIRERRIPSRARRLWLTAVPLVVVTLVVVHRPKDCRADTAVSGHLKYQPSVELHDSDSLQGHDTSLFQALDQRTRLSGATEDSRWTLSADVETLALFSADLARQRALLQASRGEESLLPRDEHRLVTLRAEVVDEEDTEVVSGFDRLLVGYRKEDIELRIGRQAVSWGNGLSFSVLDVFNPFSPVEIDRDYKPGDDMAVLQWLLPQAAELQLLAVGHRDDAGDVSLNTSSFATRLNAPVSALAADVELIAAAHYGEDFYGLGVSRTLFDGVLRVDISYSGLEATESALSLLLNYDRTWVVLEKNVYGFVEYFYSGYGEDQRQYATPSSALTERIARGELFLLGKEYLSTGLRIEWTPLLQSITSAVFNLHDESGISQARWEYEVLQDLVLIAGIDAPFGPKGSEFGGVLIPSAPPPAVAVSASDADLDSTRSFAASVRGYLRISYFF